MEPSRSDHLKRDPLLDALKGFAILLVIAGHVLVYSFPDPTAAGVPVWAAPAIRLIYSFHMPLFMAVSGYLAFGRIHLPLGRWLLGKSKRLLVPYLAWWSLPYLFNRKPHAPGVLGYLAGLPAYLARGLASPADGLWFLYVLFLCFVVIGVAWRLDSPRAAAYFAAVWAGVAVLEAVSPTTALGLNYFAGVGVWFVAGFLVAQFQTAPVFEVAWVPVGVGLAFPVIFFASPADLTGLAAWVQGMALAGAGIVLSVIAVRPLTTSIAGTALAWLGRRSMGLYVTHAFLLGVYATTLHGPLGASVLTVLAATAVTLAISLGAIWVLERTGVTRMLFLGEAWQSGKRVNERL